MNDVNNRLKQIKIEDNIWIIYLGIIILSFYSNSLEEDYYLNNNLESKKKYKETLITIFSILVVVYLYFLNSSYDDLNNLKNTDSKDKKDLITLSFIASLLIALSGFIYLYIACKDQNLDVELAFN